MTIDQNRLEQARKIALDVYKPTWLANQKTGEVPSRVAIFFGCLFGSIMLFFASGLFTKNTVEVAEVKAQL